MNTSEIKKLIDDTLYNKRMEQTGCFVDSLGAKDLRGVGVAAMPLIEKTVLEEIFPVERFMEPKKFDRRFPGFQTLLITYCKIARKSHSDDLIFQLFKRFPPALNLTIVQVIQLVWVTKEAPPPALIGLIRDIANGESASDAEYARFHLQRTWNLT